MHAKHILIISQLFPLLDERMEERLGEQKQEYSVLHQRHTEVECNLMIVLTDMNRGGDALN